MYAKSSKVANVYDDSTPNDIFIKGVNGSVCHSLEKIRASSPQVSPINIAFKTKSVLAIQKKARSPHITEIRTPRQNSLVKEVGISRLPTLWTQKQPHLPVGHLDADRGFHQYWLFMLNRFCLNGPAPRSRPRGCRLSPH